MPVFWFSGFVCVYQLQFTAIWVLLGFCIEFSGLVRFMWGEILNIGLGSSFGILVSWNWHQIAPGAS